MQRFVVTVIGGALILLASQRAEAVCLGGTPNGVVTPLEDCDDGNAMNGDGCSATCTIEAEYSCTRSVSFANLNVQDFTGSTATWVVSPDNSSGLQTQNTARPTIAVFGEDAMRGTFAVRMTVETTQDDDFIGLALGFNPGDQNNPNANYLIVDWKQLLQDGVQPGLKVAHVRGIPTAADHVAHGIPLRACPNATTSCVTQLADARTLGSTGWADNTPYTMRITYQPDRFELVVNGSVEFALKPSDFPGQFPGNVFPAGQLGFYLLSQENVRYTNLVGNGASVCNVTQLASARREVGVGTPDVTFDIATLLTDVGDALAPLSVAITSIVGGTGTVAIAPNGAVTFTPTDINLAATYVLSLFACDNDEVIADCDTSTLTIRYAGDTDGDGRNDLIDLDDDNDGIPDSVEYGKDTDGDGAFDDVDLDSDNDGLPDVVEAGHGQADANGDGLIDCPGGFGTNGLCDAVETTPDSGMGMTPPIDTDNDGIPDFRDIDSDDDGLPDRMENGTPCADTTPANNVCDGGDGDRDGSPGSADGKPGFGVNPYPTPPDTDGDGTPDYRDLDADGDGIPDIVESGGGASDPDGDGRVNGPDADRDGLKDARDDSDGDGSPDSEDTDPPVFGGTRPQVDTDGDGIPDVRDPDSDNDGLPDVDESGEDPNHPVDRDEDGTPDFQDPDSDNDMINDAIDNCRYVSNEDQADQGGDGLGDVCDLDDNDDGFLDDLGVSGGGCQASGNGNGATGLGVLLGLAGMVLARRRRRSAAASKMMTVAVASAGAVGALAAVEAKEAQAQVSSQYSAERFALTGHRDGILGVEWADVRGHLTVDLGLWFGYANDPVNVYRMSDGDRVGSLVANRIGGDLVAAIHLKNRFELGIAAPLIIAQSEDLGSLMAVPGTDISGFGLGDLRLTPKATLFRRGKLAMAAMMGITLPTSTSDDYGGDDGVSISPALALSSGGGVGIRFAAAAGYRARPKAQALDLTVDDEVFGQAGLAYRFPSSFELDATFDVATGADDILGAFNRNHAEARGGAAYDATRRVRVFGALGAGLAEGFGTPDWRALVGLRLLAAEEKVAEKPRPPRVIDSDGDGIMDPDDRCVAEPETKNDFEDSDGCPDNPDPDGDKIVGTADACPMEAEDLDGFTDTDGCPDPDNDKDTVLDVEDSCRDVPGLVELRGCPDPDRDLDTVVDRKDNCPDEPGTVENQGCKDKQRVKIVGNKIEILDIVYFSLNRAVIEKRSYSLLDQVASVILAHPEITKIRAEGHTDNQGNDVYNKKLSQRRADAVKAYLVSKGIVTDRLEAVGFGEEQPKADNTTKEGRATNRRVEFTITGGEGVEVKTTGPGEDTMEKK